MESPLSESLTSLRDDVLSALAKGETRRQIWDRIVMHPGYHARLKQAAQSTLRRWNRSPGDVLGDDLASEATLILTTTFRSDASFPWRPTGDFTHWLGTIVTRACRTAGQRLFSHDGEHVALGEAAAELPASDDFEAAREELRWVRVQQAIAALDEPCRYLLQALIILGQKQRQIAEVLGYTESWVTSKKLDCLRQLETYLAIVTANDL